MKNLLETENNLPQKSSEIIIYQTEDGQTKDKS
jgi:hypothetical protein